MSIELDFTQIKDDDYIPPGLYHAQVSSATARNSRSGFPVLEIVFTLLAPGFEGRKAYYSPSLLPQSMQYTRRALIALGVPMEKLIGKPTLEPTELIGRECQLYFTYASGDVARTRVDTIYPPKEVEITEAPTIVPF